MISLFKILLLSFALSISNALRADVLVLVHGYLSNAQTWESSGINPILDQNGWKRVGMFVAGPHGPQLLTTADTSAKNKVYTVNLPSELPIHIQTDYLLNMLDQIRAINPDEHISLVGHSAGGVIARLALVRGGASHVDKLITIASPHSGTSRAAQALDVTTDHGPLNVVKSVFGGSGYDALRHSRGLLNDLTYPHPGSLLYWLNTQTHPDIEYVSIIRSDPAGFLGDDIVPGFSQDMNNVPALQGKSKIVVTPTGHTLVAQDALTILSVIQPAS